MLARLQQYGPINSHDVVKALALLFMTIDHIGMYVLVDELWWRAVGRTMVPVWFFLIGYARTSRITTPLWVYAVLLIAVNVVTEHALLPANVLISIIFCRLALNVCEGKNLIMRYPAEIIVACCFGYFLTIPFFEYGALAIGFAMFGRMVREEMHGPMLQRIAAGLALFFTCFQSMAFEFNIAQCAFVAVGTSLCCYALYRFKIVPVPVPQLLNVPMLICARYSLEYYVLHRTLLQAIGFALGVGFSHFTWVKF